MLSRIQTDIIAALKNAESLRYSEMRPDNAPNDLFNYHLRSLVRKGIVEKIDDRYGLSERGQIYVADTYHSSDRTNKLFKINVITIVSRIHAGKLQILTQKRNSQPSHGQVGVMGGTILKGESFVDGANRKLQQETGLGANFQVVGIERRRLYKSDKLFSDILFPICYSDQWFGELVETTEFGHNYWEDIDQAILNDTRPYDSIDSIREVLISIRDNKAGSLPFFFKETEQKILK